MVKKKERAQPPVEHEAATEIVLDEAPASEADEIFDQDLAPLEAPSKD